MAKDPLNPLDQLVVYIALKNVFKGTTAGVGKAKHMRKLITKNQNQQDVADLIRVHSVDAACNTSRTLLTEQVFKSALKAKIRFPEVFGRARCEILQLRNST
jgi:hypothetical protein